MEPKNKTFLEKIGFGDEDLKTSEHDEIMLWLLDKSNIMSVIEGAFGVDYEKCIVSRRCRAKDLSDSCTFNPRECSCDFSCNLSGSPHIPKEDMVNMLKEDFETLKKVAPLKNWKQIIYDKRLEIIEKVKLEKPITSGNYIIGFADCCVILRDLYLYNGKAFSIYVNIRNRPFNIPSYTLWIEVKTKINSIGALLRQINTYRTYTEGVWMVISPEDWVEKALRSQSIYHYQYNLKR